ncbi:conserved hypothetical protein [Bacillus sp. 349Y]|nr:conserved hypothetical protein [Bacillus sp. 349Y]
MMFKPTKARREKMKAVVGFIGCSGSGKTAGALLTAYGMMREAYPDLTEEEIWDKIGVIDTEHGRAKLYAGTTFGEAHIGHFLHIDFEPPYSTKRYDAAVQAMKQYGAEVIIVDSLSHNWQGEGGIVETHGQMSGNSFQNWGKLAPETTALVKTLTRNDVHIFATLRTKQEYVVEQNSEGKSVPRKVGTKPVQKDEMEYEFMLNFSIGIDHMAETSKDNTQMFEGKPLKITQDVGRKLYQWLELGVDVKAEEEARRLNLIDEVKQMSSTSDEAAKKVAEFEFKANMKLDDFPINLAQLAIERLREPVPKKEAKK